MKALKFLSLNIFLIFYAFIGLCFCAKNFKNISEELIFVGENIKILTIASRKPETEAEAPAIAQVITEKMWQQYGLKTVAEVLSYFSGFDIINLPDGSKIYFRGIPESILFLYDGIPLTSDATKALHPIDEEISLDALSRIEIIRGPGSVLWGPDAFAGIINLVPKKGREQQRLKTGTIIGTKTEDKKIYISKGFINDFLETYLYISRYQKEQFKNNWSIKHLNGHIENSYFNEAIITLNLLDKLKITGRLSDTKRKFIKEIKYYNQSWPAQKKEPINFIKIESTRKLEKSSITFKGYYTYLKRKIKELKLETKQKNQIIFGEIFITRELKNKKGLITFGGSYKKNIVKDSTINTRGFLPEYLLKDSFIFSPIEEIADFNTELKSFYGQIKYYFSDKIYGWAGGRIDDHNQYKTTFSYNIGTTFLPEKDTQIKIIAGKAFRTPYSVQFLKNKINPEKIWNISLFLSKKFKNQHNFSLNIFYNEIKNHVNEDDFGGYSLPSKEKFWGIETNLNLHFKKLNINFNFTKINNWGEKEKYKVLDYIIITPLGEKEEHYSYYNKDFETGAKTFANTNIIYHLNKNLLLSSHIKYIGSRKINVLYYKKKYRFPKIIIWDLNLKYVGKIKRRDIEYDISIRNVFDKKYYIPGSLGPIKGNKFNVLFYFNISW